MKKCSIYLRNSELDPASYYRIAQYASNFKCEVCIHDMFTKKEYVHNLNMKKGARKKIYQLVLLIKTYFRGCLYLKEDIENDIDAVIIQREITPRIGFKKINRYLHILAKKTEIFWDFDDNIIDCGEIDGLTAYTLSSLAQKIVVTHSFLANTVDNNYRSKIICLPTTDLALAEQYTENNILHRLSEYENRISLIWIGTSTNLPFLEEIIPWLDKAAKKIGNKQIVLKIVCNLPLNVKCDKIIIENIKWSRQKANTEIKKAHIGIMPLRDNAVTRGKGAFKLLQYMAMGLPIVGSPVGYNLEVIKEENGFFASNEEEWINAIIKLGKDRDKWEECSKHAREIFLNEFNPQENIKIWNSIINHQYGE